MTTQADRIIALAEAIGTDIKALNTKTGTLSSLNTTAKTSLVAAINELESALAGAGAHIDDTTASSSTVYSSTKTEARISAAISALLDGAPAAYDTLKEIADYIASDSSATSALVIAVGNRVRYDEAQTLTAPQMLQACNNIGVGDPTTNFVTAYEAKRDA